MPALISHTGYVSNAFDNFSTMSGNVVYKLKSTCDPERIYDEIELPVFFNEACSKLDILKPSEGWSANLEEINDGAGSFSSSDVNIEIDVIQENFKNWSIPDSAATTEQL